MIVTGKNLETIDKENIKCPWVVLAGLFVKSHKHIISVSSLYTASLFECNPRTLGVILQRLSTRRNQPRMIENVLRVERYKFLYDTNALNLFDTIYAATLKDKASAEIMLEMLGTSLERES